MRVAQSNQLVRKTSSVAVCVFSGLWVQLAIAAVSLDTTIRADDKDKPFERISAIAADIDGNWQAVDSERGSLLQFAAGTLNEIKLAGGDGKAFESNSITGIARIDENQLILSNKSDDSVVIVDNQGSLIATVARGGSNAGELDSPQAVAWSANRRLYVADAGNNRISVFGTDGVFIRTIGQSGLAEEQRLQEPGQVLVDANERVYVLESRDRGIVSIFDHDGVLIKRLSSGDVKKLVGSSPEIMAMAIDDAGLLYLADNNNGRVYQIDWQQQKMLSAFGSKGEQRGQFEEISALAVLSDGRVAVADYENKKIEIYRLPDSGRSALQQLRLPTVGYERDIKLNCTSAYRLQGGNVLCVDNDNNKVGTFSSSGRAVQAFSGDFSSPVAASVDDQNVVILDDDDLKIYKLDGKQRYKVGGSGDADGKLDSPKGVYLRGNKIYVADTGNQRVQIFSSDGIYLQKISNPENGAPIFREPTRVVADSSDTLYVLEQEKKQVLVFSSDYKLQYSIGRAPNNESDDASGDIGSDTSDRFRQIYDIAVDNDNNLYILCATPENRTTVLVYNGPTRVLSFGAPNEQRTGMQEPVTLSVAPARKTVVSVFDTDRRGMLNYEYMQLPARVGGLEVNGSTDKVTLNWQKVPGGYISRYKIYASVEQNGPYRYVSDVSTTSASLEHDSESINRYYKVSAVSGFSVEGELSNSREDIFQAGYALYREQNYEQAAQVFAETRVQQPNNGEVLKYLGLSALELGKMEDAVGYFTELAQFDGYAVEGLNLQIRALVQNRDYVAARAVVDKVIADNTASIDSIVYCGELSLMLGDAIGAVTCLEQALEKQPDNARAHLLIGRAYIKLGIADKGMAEFKQAVEIDPNDAEIRYQTGLAYIAADDNDKAIQQLGKALELDTTHQAARLGLARLHLKLKQYDQAKNIAIKLAGNRETEADGQYLLGLTALATGDNGQALLALNKATRADAANDAAWLALADTYIEMNQSEKVRDLLAKAVAGNKRSFAAASRLGTMDYQDGKFEQAAESLQIAANLKPDDYRSQYHLADALLQTGAYKQAKTHAQTAAKLENKNTAPLVLLAELSNKQGKNGEAIDYIKQAMQLENNSAALHTRLGALYVENSLFDQAKTTLEKAALLDAAAAQPYVLLGALYTQRRLFDEAITALDKAVSLDASADNKLALDAAYAEKKKSMEFKSNAPSVVLKDLRLEKVFSAAYKQYSEKPIGSVRIHNTSAQDYGNLKLTFSVKGYMDFPATTDLPMLKGSSSQQIDLFAAFNNKVLDIDEDTGVQVEVAVNFIRDGRNDSIRITQPMTIYGKNAIVWGESNMVGSFVTPKDDTLRDFVRQAINENKPEAAAIDESLLTAMTLFDVFGTHGIKYVVDPNSPYSGLTDTTVDYVQFSRETLKLKSGDCDDLSVLMSASLENLGIETAILDVPGHLLMMFNTGLSENQRESISLDEELMVIHQGNIWLPLEVTMVGQSFAEAWAEGARKFNQHNDKGELKIIAMKQAWQQFKPVTLKPASYVLAVPEKSRVTAIVQREKNLLLEKSLDRLVKPYRAMVAMNPDNIKARMQVAIIYAKYGLHDAANKEFEKILKDEPDNSAVFNNRGNIYFSTGDFERALEDYAYAEKLASNDAGIKMNLSMAYYKQGNLQTAGTKYEEASMIDDSVADKYAGYVKLLSN